MKPASVVALLQWTVAPALVSARSWTQLAPLSGYSLDDPWASAYLTETDPLFTPQPSATPSASPSGLPTNTPSNAPSNLPSHTPSSFPTVPPDPYPTAPAPDNPDAWYFNYNTTQGAKYGPGYPGIVAQSGGGFAVVYKNNDWSSLANPPDFYWREFDYNGFGPWNGTLANWNPTQNRCGNVGLQSPIDIRPSGAICYEHHQVRERPGDMRIIGDKIEKQILSNKLRLLFGRRPCSNLNDPACDYPSPPRADFPHGWPNTSDALHLDIKVPGEHMIEGVKFDAEMQIFHLHPSRRRVPVVAVMITANGTNFNSYFDQALQVFEEVYLTNQALCATYLRTKRQLVTEAHAVLGVNTTSRYTDYQTWAEYSTKLDHPNATEHAHALERSLVDVWDPYNVMLVPTIWFYRYEGSLTDPPCAEWVSWFMCDTPMTISVDQLDRLKSVLFNNVDALCQKTSVQFGHSVARPIQETAGRPVWRCTSQNFGPDPPGTFGKL